LPNTVLFSRQQIKKHLIVIIHVTNPLDDTLEALQNIQDAINTVKTRKTVISEKQILQDYDKIISHLEDGAASLLNAVVIFQKHERPL
jgi:capsular polysaccharide biosynthesis protein